MLTNSRTSASNVNEDFIASSPYLWVRCLVLKSLRMNARQQFVFGLVPKCTVYALIRHVATHVSTIWCLIKQTNQKARLGYAHECREERGFLSGLASDSQFQFS